MGGLWGTEGDQPAQPAGLTWLDKSRCCRVARRVELHCALGLSICLSAISFGLSLGVLSLSIAGSLQIFCRPLLCICWRHRHRHRHCQRQRQASAEQPPTAAENTSVTLWSVDTFLLLLF